MLATIINACAVLIGSFTGLLLKRRINESMRLVVFVAAGMISLTIGIMMALKTEHVLYLAVSLVAGGIIGTLLRIEDGVLRFGEWLRSRAPAPRAAEGTAGAEGSGGEVSGGGFARGFLEATVLFCVGSMAILGSIQAGTDPGPEGYKLLLTKSVLDGVISILLAGALGAGVAAAALSIFIYQGILTLLAGLLQPLISPLILSMISSVGGPMVMMIGVNLLGLKKIPTANFLPALVLAVLCAVLDPYLPAILKG